MKVISYEGKFDDFPCASPRARTKARQAFRRTCRLLHRKSAGLNHRLSHHFAVMARWELKAWPTAPTRHFP